MAKKEQCNLCKGYNPQSDLCTIKWEQPSFDGVDCDKFQSQDKAKPKPEDYYDSMLEEIKREITDHLIDYVDDVSPDVAVRYPESPTSNLSEYMVIDDGKVRSVRNFL